MAQLSENLLVEPDHHVVFIAPDLTYSQPPYFPVSPGAATLLKRLVQDHFLVLGGRRNPDKRLLARHLAWLLADTQGLDRPGTVVEWMRNSGVQRLEIELESVHSPPIVILPDLSPHHLGHNLLKLRSMVQFSGHYILVVTDTEPADWFLGEEDQKALWVDAAPAAVYDQAFLLEQLRAILADSPNLSHLTPAVEVYPGACLGELALRLEAPYHIQTFLRRLADAEGAWQRQTIEQWISEMTRGGDALERRLCAMNFREQVLCGGLVLFDGLAFGAFFAAMEVATERVWRRRDPRLRMFDRGDLAFFSDLLGSQHDAVQIASSAVKSQMLRFMVGRRLDLLKGVLPLLGALVRESADYEERYADVWGRMQEARDSTVLMAGHMERDLYGTSERCGRLRLVIGEFLGMLGGLAPDLVERSLVELAAHPSPSVQAVAARAMASWREYPETEPHLFRQLRVWRYEMRVMRDIAAELGGADAEETARAHILTTLCETVAVAAAYDPPNRMAPELVEALEDLGKHEAGPARLRFHAVVIPAVLQRHVRQLADHVMRWIACEDRTRSVARGFALALSFQHEEARAMIEAFRREVDALAPAGATRPPGRREHLRAMIVLIHGYREDVGRGCALEAYEDWWRVLAEENCLLVRRAVFPALQRYALRDFRELQPCLQQMTHVMQHDEFNLTAQVLADVYLAQRMGQEGGERSFVHQGHTYPVWLTGARPLTAVEQAVAYWAQMKGQPTVSAVAAAARRAFQARLDDAEVRFIADEAYRRDLADPSLAAVKRRQQYAKKRSRLQNGLLETLLMQMIVTNKALRPKIRMIMPDVWRKSQNRDDLLGRLAREELAGPEIVHFIRRLLIARALVVHGSAAVSVFVALAVAALFL